METPYGIAIAAPDERLIPLLIRQELADMWVLALADPDAYGILMGTGFRSGRALFTGEVTVHGRPAMIRQRWELAEGGLWRVSEERHRLGLWEIGPARTYRRVEQ